MHGACVRRNKRFGGVRSVVSELFFRSVAPAPSPLCSVRSPSDGRPTAYTYTCVYAVKTIFSSHSSPRSNTRVAGWIGSSRRGNGGRSYKNRGFPRRSAAVAPRKPIWTACFFIVIFCCVLNVRRADAIQRRISTRR